MTKRKFLEKGQRFGKLTIIELNEIKPYYDKNNVFVANKESYKCRCDCGNEVIVSKGHLKSGHTKSCGCILKKHLLCNTRLYRILGSIKNRCLRKGHPFYKDYGGRGITICQEWLNDFMSFYNWAISNGYKDNLSIDRIDNNKGYYPENCRWVTKKEQANNKRNTHLITYNGMTKNLSEWSLYLGLNRSTVRDRLARGWTEEEAVQPKK